MAVSVRGPLPQAPVALAALLSTINAVSAIAVAELRSAWRSVRGRLFGCAVVVFTAWLFGGYMYWHANNPVPYLASAYSLPRFLIAQFGAPLLWLCLLGLLLILFDARHRDERAGVADALDSRPASNTVRLCGRLAADVVAVWLTAAAALGAVQAFGALARATDWWMGDTIEPISLVSFLFVDLLPALAVWGAVVLALTSCLHSRVAVLLGASALLGLLAWLAANMPVYLHEALLPFAAPVGFASDLAPHLADGFALAQRAGILAAAFGLMVLSARFASRLEDRAANRKAAFRGGGAATAGGVALAWAVIWQGQGADRPNARGGLAQLGSFALRLRAGAVDQAIAFDGRTAIGGWNALGEYDLPAGTATLVVGTRTNGRVVVADAIRWQAVDARAGLPRNQFAEVGGRGQELQSAAP